MIVYNAMGADKMDTYLCRTWILITVKMFEMWNNVSTKLEVQQPQSQQPHTSSGSIKGMKYFFFLLNNADFCNHKLWGFSKKKPKKSNKKNFQETKKSFYFKVVFLYQCFWFTNGFLVNINTHFYQKILFKNSFFFQKCEKCLDLFGSWRNFR